MMSDTQREETVALLQARLHEGDEQITVPSGLADRILASAPQPSPRPLRRLPSPRRRAGLSRPALVLAVALAVGLIAWGSWWAALRPAPDSGPAKQPYAFALTVFNVERACRAERSAECALRLAVDPHRRYSDPGNRAGRVWHGDRVQANCVVPEGLLLTDEKGMSSTRWYHVRTAAGVAGWLPGVRAHGTDGVPACAGKS